MNGNKSITRARDNASLLKLEVPGVGEDGVLPHDQWDKNLEVLVPNSDFVAGSLIRLTVHGLAYGSAHTVSMGEANQPGFRFKFELAHTDFPAGNPLFEFPLSYTVTDPDTGVVTVSPYAYVLVFDKEPPGSIPLAYPGFTQEQLEGVYPADVALGNLRATLVPWPKMAEGDTLTPWLGNAPADGNTAPGLIAETAVVIAQGQVGRQVNVLYPEARIKALGDVPQHFGYQLQDKLGNASSVSPTREIPVHLQDPKARRPHSPSKSRPVPKVKRLQNPVYDQLIIAGIRPSDGRIPVAMLGSTIDVTIPALPAPNGGEVVQLSRNGSTKPNLFGAIVPMSQTGTTTVSFEVADFPPADGSDYPNVRWTLDYFVADGVTGDEAFAQKPLQVIFDRYAPAGDPPTPGAISFTPEQLSGITEDDMDLVADGLKVHIASWFDDDVDDQVELWLGDGPAVGDGAYLSVIVPPVTNPAIGLDVVFPRTDLEALTPGIHYFGYRVTDWAGNVSNLSTTTGINVYLKGVPTDLLPPLIPEAEPYNPEDGTGTPAETGLLTWDEANTSTTVQIPIYTGVAAGDRIYIKWNTETSIPPVTVTQQDIDDEQTNGYLLETELPFEYIKSGTPGSNIKVWYQVHAVTNAPPVDAPGQYINVNLETAGGGEDPDPETPEHENMRPLTVLSDFPGSLPDIIPPEAFNSPAKLSILRIGVNGSPIWQLGDTISIFWGLDHTDDPADVLIDGSNDNLNPLVIPIPAQLIADNGTGDIPVYYVITRPLDANGNVSTAKSVDTVVKVISQGELPGGPAGLALASFPESVQLIAPVGYPHRAIQRAVGMRGTTFQIPLTGVANVAAGDFITFKFYGVEDPLDITQGGDIDPSKPQIDESVIEATDYVIKEADIDRGYYEVQLPYAKTYYICRNLSVTNYSIRNASGTAQAPQTLIFFGLSAVGAGCTLP